jgi:hypothetical protein
VILRFGTILLSKQEGSIFTIRNALIRVTTTNTATRIKEKRDFQVCHATDSLLYFCEGPKYDHFADKFEAFLSNVTHYHDENSSQVSHHTFTTGSKSHCWGKRKFPFPANATILAVGNSHTRQVLLSIKCQYPTLQYHEPAFNETESNATVKRRSTYYVIEFLNHAKMHLLTNHALFYSRKWRQYLESMVKMKLESFDLLIVGKINTFNEAFNSSFMVLMMEKAAELEEADFKTVPPPTLYEFAHLYSGPIVAHSMMADYGRDILNQEMLGLVKRVNRPNLHFVNGRTYIPLLGEECASDQWDQISDCLPKASQHRCIGRRGGHPDLVAWDIIEAVHNYSNSCP